MSNEDLAMVSWLLVFASAASLIVGLMGLRRYFDGGNGATALILLLLSTGIFTSGDNDTNSLGFSFSWSRSSFS